MYSKTVTIATTGDQTLLDKDTDAKGPGGNTALGANQSFRIHQITVTTVGAVNLTIYNGPSASLKDRKSYAMGGAATTGVEIVEPYIQDGHFDCDAAVSLIGVLSGNVSTRINIVYSVIGVP